MYTRDTFHMADRIIGASRHSIQLRGDNGETIFCSNKVFGRIMSHPYVQFDVSTIPAHEDSRTGRVYPQMKWIVAYLPTRF